MLEYFFLIFSALSLVYFFGMITYNLYKIEQDLNNMKNMLDQNKYTKSVDKKPKAKKYD
jgi:hypothetical protein